MGPEYNLAVHPLVAQNLTRRFGRFVAVNDVSFQIEAGEMYALLGPNGAGKSTIIRMLTGVLKPTSGKAIVVGKDVSREPYTAREHMGYMSQVFSLYRDLTVAENLAFFAGVYGATRERLEEVTERMGLAPHMHSPAKSLALGFRQRLALAAATLHQPDVLFLDEPTAGVDPEGRSEFWKLVHEMREHGTATLITTHHMDEAHLADRVGLISAGVLVAEGTPESLISRDLGRSFLVMVAEPLNACLALLNEKGLPAYSSGGTVFLDLDESEEVVGILGLLEKNGIRVASHSTRKPSLEDVFVALTRGTI